MQKEEDANVLVIIVTYNGNHWIDKCLGSLRQSSIPLDVIVIDNKSTDSTVATIEQHFPEVQLVESNENLGFGRGNNVGLKKALRENYDYAFLLNQDAWIEPDTVNILIAMHRQHPQYGIISPIHVNRTKTSLDRNFAGYINSIVLMSDLLLPNLLPKDIYTVGFINAAAWLLSKECLQKVGGFDPLFPHYGEDQDYAHRVMYNHLKIGFTPHTGIVHDREGEHHSDQPRSLAVQYNGNLIFLKNIKRSFGTNLAIVIRIGLYNALVALFTLNVGQFVTKLRLLHKILLRSSAIRRSREYCATHQGAFLT